MIQASLYVRRLCVVVVALLVNTEARVKYVHRADIGGSLAAHKIVATWKDAHRQCEREGAVLAAPITEELRVAMLHLITVNGHSAPYHIDAKLSDEPELQFVSTSGVALDDMSVIDMAERLDPRDGDCLSLDPLRVRVVSCSLPLPYLCFKPDKHDTTTTKPEQSLNTTHIEQSLNTTQLECKTSDKEYKFLASTGSCYKYHKKYLNWEQANTTCAEEGAYLVVVNDKLEAKQLAAIMALDYKYYTETHIGLHSDDKNDWFTVRGQPLSQVYHDWAEMADPYNPYRKCGVLDNLAQLKHFYCHWTKRFFCEMDPVSVDENIIV